MCLASMPCLLYTSADNEKFLYLKQKGFDYYCNVDASSEHWIQIGANKDYFRQARRNLDGTRMWEAVMSYTDSSYHNRLSDLFDAKMCIRDSNYSVSKYMDGQQLAWK